MKLSCITIDLADALCYDRIRDRKELLKMNDFPATNESIVTIVLIAAAAICLAAAASLIIVKVRHKRKK